MALRNFIEQSNMYREELVKLLNIDFDNPNKELKEFAEKSKLDLKNPLVQENFLKIRKELIDKINSFYENNFLKNDPNAIEERKKEEKELRKKKKLEMKNKDNKDNKVNTPNTTSSNINPSNTKAEAVKKNQDNIKTKTSLSSQLIFYSTIILAIGVVIYVVNNLLD